MKKHFEELETAIFHINDKGTIANKYDLLLTLRHKLELQESLIKSIEIFNKGKRRVKEMEELTEKEKQEDNDIF